MVPRARFRSSLPALLLAVVMLVSSSIGVAGVGTRATRPPNDAAALGPANATPALAGPPSHATRTGWQWTAPPWNIAAQAAQRAVQRAVITTPKHAPAKPKPAPPKPKPAKPKPKPERWPAPSYQGRNHLWIPALGISRSVGFYYCGNPNVPGLGVYRWGCAGGNNTYLLAHAFAAFKPLHDAYVHGRLERGMKAIYADASGRVRTYAVVWWRLTTPYNGAFAYAGQSQPSVTLQTCVGARSEYRLIVRLVAVD
jgi:hypothetical protein